MSARRLPALLAAALSALALAGCHTDMWIQPKVKTLQESDFFTDGRGARDPVEHTIARGQLRGQDAFETGLVKGRLVTQLPPIVGPGKPFADTREMLERGKDRFEIYCSPCHGRLGDGNGMIAQRGLALRRAPASFHTDRLRRMPIGHFVDVQTNGYGVMYSYASRVDPQDRWAIAAYIRVLQRSQNARPGDIPPGALEASARPAPASEGAAQGGGR